MVKEKDLIPLALAAEQLGVKPIALRQAIKRGRFSAVKRGRDWFTTKEAIEAYRPRTHGKKVETLTKI